jgi:hypothetical protein
MEQYAASLPPRSLRPRRRGAVGGAIACPPLAGRQSAGGGRAPSFDFAQDRESFDLAQDREPVERPFGFVQGHELVEWQMMP